MEPKADDIKHCEACQGSGLYQSKWICFDCRGSGEQARFMAGAPCVQFQGKTYKLNDYIQFTNTRGNLASGMIVDLYVRWPKPEPEPQAWIPIRYIWMEVYNTKTGKAFKTCLWSNIEIKRKNQLF